MVEILVTMSRAMYAQLHQQMFAPPRKYPMPVVADPKYKQAELGMKLTCGFEMMYWERQRFEGADVNSRDGASYLIHRLFTQFTDILPQFSGLFPLHVKTRLLDIVGLLFLWT